MAAGCCDINVTLNAAADFYGRRLSAHKYNLVDLLIIMCAQTSNMHMQTQLVGKWQASHLLSFINICTSISSTCHACCVAFVAMTSTAMLKIDTHKGLVRGLCYNSISDYVKHSSDLERKRKRETGRVWRQIEVEQKSEMTTMVCIRSGDCVYTSLMCSLSLCQPAVSHWHHGPFTTGHQWLESWHCYLTKQFIIHLHS